MTGTPIDHRLIAYGTLQPGEPNFHVVEPLGGSWTEVRVRGRVGTSNWREYAGLPAFTPDESAEPIDVMLLESDRLPEAWPDLDAFEGPGYRRIAVPMWDTAGTALGNGWIYQALHPD